MASKSDLKQLNKSELYDLARERDIGGRSDMDKEELVEALADGSAADGHETGEIERPKTTNRSIWKGSITFGLITIPVGLYTAIEDKDISFRLLSAKTGGRIRYARVDAKTGDEIDWDDIVKGYEYEDGQYVTFTHEELDKIPSDSIRAIDVVQFISIDEVDPIAYERSYYVAPEETGVKAYSLLVQALEESGRVGVAKVTIRDKEQLCQLWPREGVLVLETMNWPDEIRVPDFDQLEETPRISEEEKEMARQLIEQLSGDYEPSRFHDTYRERLEEAIEAKIEGEEVHLAEEAEPSKVTDLMEALRASVEATRDRKTA